MFPCLISRILCTKYSHLSERTVLGYQAYLSPATPCRVKQLFYFHIKFIAEYFNTLLFLRYYCRFFIFFSTGYVLRPKIGTLPYYELNFATDAMDFHWQKPWKLSSPRSGRQSSPHIQCLIRIKTPYCRSLSNFFKPFSSLTLAAFGGTGKGSRYGVPREIVPLI